MNSKSETAQNLKINLNHVENHTRNTVKCFRSDNGAEFVNDELEKILREKGIKHELSAPYDPE